MGDYVPSKLSMEDGEHVVGCKMIYDIIPEHHVLYVFENGKGLRVPMSVYQSKSRRRKISGAYNTASALAGIVYEADKPVNVFIKSDANRGMLIKSSLVPIKSTRSAAGVQVMQLPKNGSAKVDLVTDRVEELIKDAQKCKKNVIPSNGTALGQISFDFT